MTLKTELQRSVLRVMSGVIGIGNMTDEDFAFVEMCGEYGSRRDKYLADFGKSEVLSFQHMKTPVNGSTGGTGTGTGSVMPPAATIQTGPAQPADDIEPAFVPADPEAPMVDRGPEPQTVGDTISTEPPAVDPKDPPPDYTALASR